MKPRHIASHVPGRLRLRHPALGRAGTCAEIAAAIAGEAGVTSVSGNPRTAGVLVLYATGVLVPRAAEDLVLRRLASVAERERDEPPAGTADLRGRTSPRAPGVATARRRFAATYRRFRIPLNVAMLATLGGSVLALGVGRKPHAVLGFAHLGVLALHLIQYRRRLVS